MEIYSNNIKVLSKVRKRIDEEIFAKYGKSFIEDDFVRIDLENENHLRDVVGIIEKEKSDEVPGVLVYQKFIIENDEIEWIPVKTNFVVEGFALCNMKFFVEKNGSVYQIELDYDFENSWSIEINRFIDSNVAKAFVEDSSCILNDILTSMKEQKEDVRL